MIQNKIIKTELIKWKDLKFLQPDKLKHLSKESYNKLKNSLLNNNFCQTFNVWQNKNTVYLLDGHHRIKLLKDLEKEVEVPECFPANFIDCKDRKEAVKLLLVYSSIYAKLEEESLYDFLKLEEINFKDLEDEIDLPSFYFKEFDKLLAQDGKSDEELNDVPDVQKEAVSELGDLFFIDNRHRVLCGDSTKKEDVERLMEGKKADMVFTDPPYGVSYANKNKYLNAISPGNRIQTEIKNDHKTIQDLKDNIIYPAFCNLKEILSDKGSYYLTAPQGGDLLMMMMMMIQSGLLLRHMLIWCKNNHVLGRTDYNYKHEPILFGWINSHNFYGKGKWLFSTWEINKPLKSDLHPTMKPIELIENAILNSSIKDNIIIDIFLGSGSTLIACEQTNRICYGIELDQIYIDVILRRYHKLYPDKEIKCLNREFDFERLFSNG